MTTMYDNPMYTLLQQLYQRFESDAPTMKNALAQAAAQMQQNKTWVGPAATAWSNSLAGYSGDSANQVNQLLAYIYQQWQSTPQQVDEQQYQQIQQQLQLARRHE